MARNWNEETEKNVQGIVNEKSKWQAAYDAGDEEGMKEAAETAKGYYKSLTDSGNYDVAKELQQSDYDKARGYLENYKGTKPADTNRGMALENTRTATDTAKKQSDFAGNFEEMWKEGYQNQEDRINADPMDSDAAKAIMDRYRGLGEEARGDVLADGSVRNDGNLDSFTKANADAQRQAYEEAGIDSVFDLHERNVEAGGQNYRDMLSGGALVGDEYDAAVQNANVTAESATNIENANSQNDVSVQAQEAEITGYIPEELANKNNPFFNDDGELKNPEWDFQEIINNATARGDMETVRWAEAARLHKIQNVPEYAQYAPTVVAPSVQQTEAGRQFDENVKLSQEGNELVRHEIDTNADIANKQIESQERMANTDLAAQMEMFAAQLEAQGFGVQAASIRKGATGLRGNGGNEGAGNAETEEVTGADNVANAAPSGGEGAHETTAPAPTLTEAEKRDIIAGINSIYTNEADRIAAYREAGLTKDDIYNYS